MRGEIEMSYYDELCIKIEKTKEQLIQMIRSENLKTKDILFVLEKFDELKIEKAGIEKQERKRLYL